MNNKDIEDFLKQIIQAINKLIPQFYNLFKKIKFLNKLGIEVHKYIALLLIDALEKAL